MKRRHAVFTPPHDRSEWTWIRAGRDGTYWQAADGLVVRLATAERPFEGTPTQALPDPGRFEAATGGTRRDFSRALALLFGRHAAAGQRQ